MIKPYHGGEMIKPYQPSCSRFWADLPAPQLPLVFLFPMRANSPSVVVKSHEHTHLLDEIQLAAALYPS